MSIVGLVAKARLDVWQRRAARNQPCDVGVAQVVEPERRDALGQPDVDDERVRALVNVASPGASGRPAGGGPGPPVGDAAEGPHQEHDVVPQAWRGRPVLDAAGPSALGHRAADAVQEALKHGKANPEATEVLRLNPYFSLEVHKQRMPIKDPAVLERHIAALKKAGLR